MNQRTRLCPHHRRLPLWALHVIYFGVGVLAFCSALMCATGGPR